MEDCPFSLQGYFRLGIIDEAHALKDQKTQRWAAVNDLQLEYKILAIGTPVSYRDTDIEGVLAIMAPTDLWEKMGVEVSKEHITYTHLLTLFLVE